VLHEPAEGALGYEMFLAFGHSVQTRDVVLEGRCSRDVIWYAAELWIDFG
jgi:hypothetical protein